MLLVSKHTKHRIPQDFVKIAYVGSTVQKKIKKCVLLQRYICNAQELTFSKSQLNVRSSPLPFKTTQNFT